MVDKVYFCILLILNDVALGAFKQKTYKIHLAKNWLVLIG